MTGIHISEFLKDKLLKDKQYDVQYATTNRRVIDVEDVKEHIERAEKRLWYMFLGSDYEKIRKIFEEEFGEFE